ncbi:MAG: hypothetical protein HY716_05315 [Planctomycetes bacterium]|nr:hypothetical protein [Planctomycetota bacterium]
MLPRLVWIPLLAAALFVGCGSPRRYEVFQPSDVNFRQFKAVYVPPLDIQKWIEAHPEVREGAGYEHTRHELEHAQMRIHKDVLVGIQSGSLADRLQIVPLPQPGAMTVRMEVTEFDMRPEPELVIPRVKVGGVLDREEGPGWKWGHIQVTTYLADDSTSQILGGCKANRTIVSPSRLDIG